jgi:cell division protein FtsW
MIAILIAIINCFLLSSLINPLLIKNNITYIFLLISILNILPFVSFFKHPINGAMRLINFFNFIFQPSELLKFAYIANLSFIFDFYYDQINYVFTIVSIYYISTTFILINQSDFGTIIILSSITFILLWNFLYHKKILLYGFIFFILLILLLIIIKPYRIIRFISFLDPWIDPLGKSFQIIQSFIAINNGGLFGLGLGKSKQKNLFLPMCHTDFIFSIIIEEIGLILSILLIILIFKFALILTNIAIESNNRYTKNYLFGISFLIIFQTIINISASTGLLPTKGIGLPFISYGMSSTIGLSIIIGYALGLIKNQKNFK